MIRRTPLLIVAIAAGASVLSSCSTFESSTAARVNGTKIDERVVETILAPTDDTSGSSALNGDQARLALAELVRGRIAEQVAERFDIDLTTARKKDLEETSQNLKGERLALWKALSDTERNLLADGQIAIREMQAAPGSAPSNLEQRYADPKSTGYFCIRYLVLETKEAADAAYEQLQGGADFAKLANELNKRTDGGAALGPDQSPCVSIDNFRAPNVPTGIAAALFAAKAGELVAPVQIWDGGQSGWFVLLHRPWSEIGADLTKQVEKSPAFAEFLAEVARAEVDIASRFGVWDPADGTVARHD